MDLPMSTTIELGHRYVVSWRNGEKHTAEIVEQRPIKKAKDPRNNEENNVSLDLSDCEFYVHYSGFDRRLDEWVTIDRIDGESLGTVPAREFPRQKLKKSKRKFEDLTDAAKDGHEVLATFEKEYEEITKVKNICTIELGKYEIDTWYFSPYPDEYCSEEKLFICEYCLKYVKKQKTLQRHKQICSMKSPPGKEIYRKDQLSMYEIDGKEFKIYCQNLCLLSKLFLDHKTLYYDVDPFLFYVLCETDQEGSHIVGYFSKEKQSQENYNLACILTFPPYQRKGYGKFLISVSYELTKRENTTGSPEKPLSDLGKISYRSYWAYAILRFLETNSENITIQEMARQTGIRAEDILSTLHSLNLIKYWKGAHIIGISPKIIDSYARSSHKALLCDPNFLSWIPNEKNLKKTIP
eukprot:gene3804-7569_t